MPGGDGKGPFWGGGPGSGRKRGSRNSGDNRERKPENGENMADNVVAVLTGVAVLATAVVKLLTEIKSGKKTRGGD